MQSDNPGPPQYDYSYPSYMLSARFAPLQVRPHEEQREQLMTKDLSKKIEHNEQNETSKKSLHDTGSAVLQSAKQSTGSRNKKMDKEMSSAKKTLGTPMDEEAIDRALRASLNDSAWCSGYEFARRASSSSPRSNISFWERTKYNIFKCTTVLLLAYVVHIKLESYAKVKPGSITPAPTALGCRHTAEQCLSQFAGWAAGSVRRKDGS